MNKNKIYTITVCEKLKPDKRFLCDMGTTRCVGYYHKKEDAVQTVRNNNMDIWETVYDYAVIEAVESGLYPASCERWVYEYNPKTGGYEEIMEPECMKHICGISMG